MEGVTCRPDNSWYGGCQHPNTETGSNFGANNDFERCLISFKSTGSPQSINYNQLPNPTWPTTGRIGQGSLNVTLVCLTNKKTVNFLINVAFADGCISDLNLNGQVSIMDPIGDGSINGLDVLRGSHYRCRPQGPPSLPLHELIFDQV